MAFTQTGQLRPCCHLVTYPNKDAAPTPEALKTRVAALGAIYPILSARLDTSDPNHLHHVPGGTLPQVHQWQHVLGDESNDPAHALLDQVYAKTAELDTVKGPHMRIDYITATTSDQVFIGLSADHFLADGAGLRNFAQLLLGQRLPDLKKEDIYSPPIEELIDFVPPPAPPPAPKNIWPRNVPCPLDVPGTHAYFDYPEWIIDKLKPIAREHGVLTLNPVLEMAFMSALLAIAPANDEFTLYTMRDDRRSCGDQAPMWSSNYFSNPVTTFKPCPLADFWEYTHSHAEYLKDPDAMQAGRYAVGFLQHVPIPLDKLLMDLTRSEHPYIGSIFFTNMTYLDLPPGAEDFRWTSSPSPFLAPVIVHWVGHKAGLRMSLAYRNGGGIDAEQAARIGDKVGAVLDRLSRGGTGSFEEIAAAS